MYNGAPEFAVDQCWYCPTNTNYGYLCTGLESPGDWVDHQTIFGFDGQEIQYAVTQTENFPYVYYTPSYAYSESSYNPYNPYIPGAMVGFDGPYIGSKDWQQYYSISSDNTVSSAAYYSMVVQSRPDTLSNSTRKPYMDTAADDPGLKHNLSEASAAFTLKTNSFNRGSDVSKVTAGPSKQHVTHGSKSGFSNEALSHVFQGRGTPAVDNFSNGKFWSNREKLKVATPSATGFSSFGSSAHGRTMMDKLRTKLHVGRALNLSGNPDALTEQNGGLRIDKSENQFAVKAYTSRAGDSDVQGNIIIRTDQYNKDDFPVDYLNAKFFVIKSYSEDHVYKSIKYNVWSSTTHGNKKLNIAYDDAQRIAGGEPRGCPIFLFFSVNASGQFCGVAEMTGTVDFHKDMDFWQQDRWSGSFPVKWHIIKDVPNPYFQHIILENNEFKPVTSSRDTQEVRFTKGMEMLKILKHYPSKTSLLDDFMYYESRQKLLQDAKTRLLSRSYEKLFLVTQSEPVCKLNDVLNLSSEDEKITNHNDLSSSKNSVSTSTKQVSLDNKVSNVILAKDDTCVADADEKAEEYVTFEIGSLSINPKQVGIKPLEATAPGTATVVNTEPVNVVTIGSMPVQVNGSAKSSSFLTNGTITLDPRAFEMDEAGLSAKDGSRKV